MSQAEMELLTRYREEIRELKARNEELQTANRRLEERLLELHGEYQQLRYSVRGMASEAEVSALRHEILTLKRELRFSGRTVH